MKTALTMQHNKTEKSSLELHFSKESLSYKKNRKYHDNRNASC